MGHLARGAIAVLLAVVVLKAAQGVGEAITSYELVRLYILFGAGALAVHAWREDLPGVLSGDFEPLSDGPVLFRLVVAGILTLWLFGVMAVFAGPGFPEANRSITFGGIFLLVVAYPFLHHRLGRLIRRNWPYLLAFAALFGVYLLHGANSGSGSGRAAFAAAAGFLLAMNLFVIPRYVSIEDFLWAASRISGVVVLLGLFAYVGGEYALFGLPVELWTTTFSPRLLPVEIPLLQSIFGNPNTLGILAFVGTVAALVEVHRVFGRLVDEADAGAPAAGALQVRIAPRLVLPAVLLLVNGLGLYLSHSRASMLAAGAASIAYLAYVGFGREVVPRAVAATVALIVVALAAIAAGVLAIGSGGRFVLWSAGLEAFLRAPTLLGEGIVETGSVIEPYVTDPGRQGHAVHNSYLATAIRAGLVGAAAHLVLAVGSVVHALTADRAVRVAPIALGVGFALHLLFETYTLYQHDLGAVLASLAVGYVIAAIRDARAVETESSSLADVFDRRDGRSTSG